MAAAIVNEILAQGALAGREELDDIEDQLDDVLFAATGGDVDDDIEDLGAEIIAGRTTKGTKRNYKYKVKAFEDWVTKHIPARIRNGAVNLHALNKDDLKLFFGYTVLKRNKLGEPKTPHVFQSYEHISGFKSALKDHLHNNDVDLSPPVVKFFKDFFKGSLSCLL